MTHVAVEAASLTHTSKSASLTHTSKSMITMQLTDQLILAQHAYVSKKEDCTVCPMRPFLTWCS